MFNRILVPVDGSDTAASAAAYALRLAESFDSDVIGLYVVDVRLIEGPLLQTIGSMWGDLPMPTRQGDLIEALEKRGREVLDDFEQRARDGRRTFESVLEIGVVPDVIADRARPVDLVVIGRRGEHAAFGEHPLGSTVHSVVRRSPKPVLVCPRGEVPLRRPLVAYDGSEHAARALELGVEYAERRRCPLQVVSVQGRREEADRLLEEARDFARGHDLEAVPHARESDKVVEMVLEVARENGSDLLVMGAYGKGRLREFLLGSTTESILAQAGHPVLLYR
ncbi:MAG: universal stress protein [Gemmatimonadetes bacterium]|nr:universal stress protein [Gemmatimonadota bacterium]